MDTTKLFFIEIKTVGAAKTVDTFKTNFPNLYKEWESYLVWMKDSNLLKTVDGEFNENSFFLEKAGAIPEFSKVICVSFGFMVGDNNEIKTETYSFNSEKETLTKTAEMLERIGKLNFSLCGYNLKNFHIPFLGKRMLINRIKLPSIFPKHDTKPWEVKVVDLKDLWNFNTNRGLVSFNLMTQALNGDREINQLIGNQEAHKLYWDDSKTLELLSTDNEESVRNMVTMIKEIKNYL